jgi:hypothetical protein
MNNMEKLSKLMEGNLARASGQIDPGLFVSALAAAIAAAFVASLLYRFFYERRGTGSQVHRAFPLLAVSITTLFIGVQISLPLSLGLLGSLSIIRFRTPIKEPEEVGFIMLVIAASIAAATFNFALIAYLYAGAFLCLLAMRGATAWRYLRRDGLLVLALDAAEASAKFRDIEAFLDGKTRRHILESSSTRSGQTTYQYVFSGLVGDVAELQASLSALAPFTSINVFLDRPGGIR